MMLVLTRPGGGCGQPQTEFDVGRAQRSSRFVTPTLVVGRLHTQLAPRMSVQGADGTDDAGRRLRTPTPTPCSTDAGSNPPTPGPPAPAPTTPTPTTPTRLGGRRRRRRRRRAGSDACDDECGGRDSRLARGEARDGGARVRSPFHRSIQKSWRSATSLTHTSRGMRRERRRWREDDGEVSSVARAAVGRVQCLSARRPFPRAVALSQFLPLSGGKKLLRHILGSRARRCLAVPLSRVLW